MASVSTNLQLVIDKRKENQPLYKRYDQDQKLAVLEPYEMKDLKGRKTPDVINVTMNEAQVFLSRATAIMNGANMQRSVFGRKLKDEEATTIEEFFDDLYYDVDVRFVNRHNTGLYGFLIGQLLGRGAAAVRCLMRQDGDDFVPDITGHDVRYFAHENDSTGTMWAAPFATQSKAQIERDYGIVLNGNKGAVVTDFWDDKVNEIYIADKVYLGGKQTNDAEKHPERVIKHGLDGAPFVYMQSGVGLQSFMDDGILKDQGESLFVSNRGLIPQLHHAASIFMTLTDMSFEGALQLNLEEPGTGDKPPVPFGRRKVNELGINEKYALMPVADVKNATRLLYNMLVGALQRGGLPNIDYGGLSFPLSAVAISKLTASKDAIFIPRLNALAYIYRALSKMIKSQFIAGGYREELGEEGVEREYDASDIDKKFSTKYEFHSTSPEQDIANYAIGQQAMALGVSRETVFTTTLKFNDPIGEINKARAEKVEAGDIAQTLFKAGLQQIEDEELELAEMTLQQLEMVLRQRSRGMDTGLAPGKGGLPAGPESIKPMVPMLGGDSSTPVAAPQDDQAMPAGDEDEARQERREDTASRSRETADQRG